MNAAATLSNNPRRCPLYPPPRGPLFPSQHLSQAVSGSLQLGLPTGVPLAVAWSWVCRGSHHCSSYSRAPTTRAGQGGRLSDLVAFLWIHFPSLGRLVWSQWERIPLICHRLDTQGEEIPRGPTFQRRGELRGGTLSIWDIY